MRSALSETPYVASPLCRRSLPSLHLPILSVERRSGNGHQVKFVKLWGRHIWHFHLIGNF
ncbi:MAG: hypothetical protein MUC60_15735 [Oscillatoria sp. Prado101]|nr:hypothetical protein [Oscillatoria sp. Prado101]